MKIFRTTAVVVAVALSILPAFAAAAKPVITPDAAGDWFGLDEAPWNTAITSSGDYIAFAITNLPKGSSTAIIRAVRGNWKIEEPGARLVGFSKDGRLAVVRGPEQTLSIYTLGGSSIERIRDVGAATLGGGGEWLIYQTNGSERMLVLRDLGKGTQRQFSHVTKFLVSTPAGLMLTLHRNDVRGDTSHRTLESIDLNSGDSTVVWAQDGPPAQKVIEPQEVLDENQRAVVWATEAMANDGPATTIWYFKRPGGTEARASVGPEKLVTDQSPGIDPEMRIAPPAKLRMQFGGSGQVIHFNLVEKGPVVPKANDPSVDVWSYKDPQVQSVQLADLRAGNVLTRAAMPLGTRRVISLGGPVDQIGAYGFLTKEGLLHENHVIIYRHLLSNFPYPEVTWNSAGKIDVDLISLADGRKRMLATNIKFASNYYSISTGGRYLLYFDFSSKNWFSLALDSDRSNCITQNASAQWSKQDEVYPDTDTTCRKGGIAGWLEDDSFVLIYSQNDIWRIDPSCKVPPVNLTRCHTSRNNVQFEIVDNLARALPIGAQSSLLIKAVDQDTHEEGLIRIRPGEAPDDQVVAFVPASLLVTAVARDGGTFVIRQTAADAPNLYYTTDLVSYVPLSDIHPERAYQWLTAESHTWQTVDGRRAHGVLYKPENFDPKRKYPIILEYYDEDEYAEVNGFPSITPGSSGLTPPLLTGRGYLVLSVTLPPFTVGNPGQNTCDAIVGAAQYLASKPWVDAKHMALRGQSFGAYETDYIVAHTDIFAAAVATCGWADFVSASNGIVYPGSGMARQIRYEIGPNEAIGGTLWTKQKEYIDSSPLFRADKVTTPMLLMNNVADSDVNWWQGVEWFMALRRLGKRAWMLQYDGEGHGVFGKKAVLDFDQRMMQFFDHYLKGAPPPKWMTEGIPAKLKGYDSGLELDVSGRIP